MGFVGDVIRVVLSTPGEFTPKSTIEVVDNGDNPQVTNACHDKERALLTADHGLSDYDAVAQVELPLMEMSRPYSDAEGIEEIWIATDGDADMLFGKGLRKLRAERRTPYLQQGKPGHANIYVSATSTQFLYMVSGNAGASAGH